MRPRIVPAVAVFLCAAQAEASAQVLRAAASVRAVPLPIGAPPVAGLPASGGLSAPGLLSPTLAAPPSLVPALPSLPAGRPSSPAVPSAALAAMAAQAPALAVQGPGAKAAAGAQFEGAPRVAPTPAEAPAAIAPAASPSALLRPALAALPPASYLPKDLESAVRRIAAAFDGAGPLPAPDTVEAYRPGNAAEKAEFEAVFVRTSMRLAAVPRETKKRVAAALDLEFGQILANRAAHGLFGGAGELAQRDAPPERVAEALTRAQAFDRDGGILYAERMPLVVSLRAQDPDFRAFSEELSGIIREMSRDGSGEGEARMNWVRKNALFSAAAEASAEFRVGKALRFVLPDPAPQAAAPASVRHGFPPLDSLLRLWLGRRETALRDGFELAGGRGEVPAFLYGERHTDAGLIKANMDRLLADLEPGRPAVLLVEGYPAGRTMPLIDAFRYLKSRGFDLEALRAKGVSLKDGDLVIRGWDDPARLERGMEMARRYASKLVRLKKLAEVDSLGEAGPLARVGRAARFYAVFVPLALDMFREWRADRRFLVTERNKDLDRALRDAVNEATWTGGSVHLVAGAHHLLENPLLTEVPPLGGLRLRRSLARALAGASWRASEAPSTLPLRTWGEAIDEMGAFYHAFDGAALRDRLKFASAFLAVARDFSRTDRIFDFADTAAVERSPLTATLIARMRKDPAVRALMDERRLMPRLDLDALAALPPGTLGGAYGRFMKKNGFTPDFYKPLDASSDYGWLAVWARQTHDFWHTAAGYTPSNADEFAVQAFGMPQYPTAQLPAVILAAGLLNAARETPEQAGVLLRSISHAYERGRAARSLVGYRWDQRLDTPLAEVRRELGIRPRADGGPTEAVQDDPRRSPPRRLSRWGALRQDLRVLRVLAASGHPDAPPLTAAVRAAAAGAVRGERGEEALVLIAEELLRTGLNRPEDLPALMEALAEGAGR